MAESALTRATQLAQGGAEAQEPAGTIGEVTGLVTLIRADGSTTAAVPGLEIHPGDTVTTAGGGTVDIAFADGGAFFLGENGRASLEEDGQIFVPQGTFALSHDGASFSGDPLTVRTPTATVELQNGRMAGHAAPEGTANVFTLLRGGSEILGFASVFTLAGALVLDSNLAAASVAAPSQIPAPLPDIDGDRLAGLYGPQVVAWTPANGAGFETAAGPDNVPAVEPGEGGRPLDYGVGPVLPPLDSTTATAASAPIDFTAPAPPLFGADLPRDEAPISPAGDGGGGGGGSANLTLTGTAGNDTLTGGAGNDTINGLAGDDTLDGAGGNDTINGDAGNDTLTGGPGNDALDGGADTDTASYASAAAGVTVDLGAGTASNDGDGGNDTLTNIENVTGSAFNDTITGDANDNVINGGAGDDTLDGAGGTDTASYAGASAGVTVDLTQVGAQNTGGAGTDTLTNFENLIGSDNNDTLTGDGNANTLSGGDGDDTLDGGGGTDTADYSSSTVDVTVDLSAGGAQNTGQGTDTLTNFENLTGSSHNDRLEGDFNANVLSGGDGDDVLTGNGGDDTFIGGAGNDSFTGNGGSDTADYSSAAASITVDMTAGGVEVTDDGDGGQDRFADFIENVTGSAFDDDIAGDNFANVLQGGAGNDTINSRGGSDTVYGGAGNDTLSGGSADDYYYAATSEGGDTVNSFASGTDEFVFLQSAFGNIAAVNNGVNFTSIAAAYDGTNGNAGGTAGFIFSTTTNVLTYDADGNGGNAGITIATVNGNPVAATDITMTATSLV